MTEPKGDPVELVKNNAGDDSWDVIEGVWSGTLRSGAGGLEPCERIINDKGELVIRSVSKSETTTADHGVGNYIGVSEILKPNTTYTVTVIAKFNSNPTHKLHIKYPGVYDNVLSAQAAMFPARLPWRYPTRLILRSISTPSGPEAV